MRYISRSKGNQTMRFCQLIEYNKIDIFIQKSCQNKEGRLVPDLSLLLKKALYEKNKRSAARLKYIGIAHQKKKLLTIVFGYQF